MRRVLRVAALCHDTGHLPFSHAAEFELLPSGWNHELITRALIYEGPLADGVRMMSPPVTLRRMSNVTLATMLEGSVLISQSRWREGKPRLLFRFLRFYNCNSRWDLMWCM